MTCNLKNEIADMACYFQGILDFSFQRFSQNDAILQTHFHEGNRQRLQYPFIFQMKTHLITLNRSIEMHIFVDFNEFILKITIYSIIHYLGFRKIVCMGGMFSHKSTGVFDKFP